MKENPYEIRRFVLVLAGFFCGLLVLVLVYFSIFKALEQPFGFHVMIKMNKDNFVLFLFNSLPFILGYTGFFIFSKIKQQNSYYLKKIKEEDLKTDQAISFSQNLTKGVINRIDVPENDKLLTALTKLQNTVIKNREIEEQRKREDKQKNWVSEGLAKFGEILRQHSEDIETLGYKLISNLVQYLNINQGGFFLTEGEEQNKPYLKMIACYAYDRKKFANKQIQWGEGIIGACCLEKKTIYLKDIPDSYLEITSGLGKSNPKTLLLIPLLNNNEVKGIIELASFSEFERYEIDFVERVAESIAMALTNMKNSYRTSQLLKETRAQAEELALQEEKARQNMNELKSIQEQASLQAEKFISFTNTVNHTLIRAEYDVKGVLLYANTKFLKEMGYSSNRDVEGKHISIFINEKDRNWFDKIWKSLSEGGKHFEGYMKHITRQGQDLWTMATYTCMRKEDGNVDKILFLAIETTEQKKQSLDFESQISALNKLNLKAEFSPDGQIIDANNFFQNTLKYNLKELDNMAIFDFLERRDLETFNETWEKVITDNPYQGQIRMFTKYSDEKWFRASLTAVNDMYDEVAKVIFLANEITNEKIMEAETRDQTERLKKQEEELKLSTIELSRKLKESNREWKNKFENIDELNHSLEKLLDNDDEISLIIDNTGILLYINEYAARLFGSTKKELLNKPAGKILDNKNIEYPEFIRNLVDPTRLKSKISKNLVFKIKDGSELVYNYELDSIELSKKIIYLSRATSIKNK